MTPDEEQKSQRDAYWRARDAADEGGSGGGSDYDVISGGSDQYAEPNAPDETTAADYPSEAMRNPLPGPSSTAVQTSAAPDLKTRRLAALDEARRLAGAPLELPGNDGEIAAAQKRDTQQRGRDQFTEALQAWLQRRPQRQLDTPSEASDLMHRRQSAEGPALRQRAQQVSVQAQIAKALTDPKADAGSTMTAYQKAELEQREKDRVQKSGDRSTALADRKRTMLSLYPEHKAEIDALTDLGDAQTLQTALEGRLGRAETEKHSDTEAVKASQRSFGNALALKEWERTHQNLTAEQKSQLEGIEKSDAALDTFQGGLGSVSSVTGKAAAAFPGISGSLGLPGADFKSLREGTAIALARGLEGGMARPGNVEIIQHMLPEATDSAQVQQAKIAHVREFVKNNRESFMRAAESTGAVVKPIPERPHVNAPAEQPPPGVIPPGATDVKKLKSGAWFYRYPDGTTEIWEPHK